VTLNITLPSSINARKDLAIEDFIPCQNLADAPLIEGGEVSGLGAEISLSEGFVSRGAASTTTSASFDRRMNVSRSYALLFKYII